MSRCVKNCDPTGNKSEVHLLHMKIMQSTGGVLGKHLGGLIQTVHVHLMALHITTFRTYTVTVYLKSYSQFKYSTI